jgi:hypothetical protein
MIEVAVLESKFIGGDKHQLQLKFLHVSQSYEGKGWESSGCAKDQGTGREKVVYLCNPV